MEIKNDNHDIRHTAPESFFGAPGRCRRSAVCFIRCDGGVCLASVKGRYDLIVMYMPQTLSSIFTMRKKQYFFTAKKTGRGFCRVCIRQYQKSTQKQALQGRNESTNQKVRTLFLHIPIKLKIFCRIKAPKNAGGFCDEKHL